MERTTLVQHVRQQEKLNPDATGEFTSLMNEIMVAAKIVSGSQQSRYRGRYHGLDGKN